MNDAREVLSTIAENPGLRTSDIVEMLDIPRARVEDAIYELWRDRRIQINRDSTLRLPRADETVFRWET